jgi:hypothetical protein
MQVYHQQKGPQFPLTGILCGSSIHRKSWKTLCAVRYSIPKHVSHATLQGNRLNCTYILI